MSATTTANPFDKAAMMAATANTPRPIATRLSEKLATASYATGLPFDTYTTAVDPATGAAQYFGYQADEQGVLQRIPSIAQRDSADGLIKQGEQHKDAQGRPQFQGTGQYLLSSRGVRVRLYDSIVDKLLVSTDDLDRDLAAALTSDGAHDVCFSGAQSIAVVAEKVTGSRGNSYTVCRLVAE